MSEVSPQMNANGSEHPVLSAGDVTELVTPLADGSTKTPYVTPRAANAAEALEANNKRSIVVILTRESLKRALDDNAPFSDLLADHVKGRGSKRKLGNGVATSTHRTENGNARKVHFVNAADTDKIKDDRTARFRNIGATVGPLLYEFKGGSTLVIPAELVDDLEFLKGLGQGIGNSTATPTKKVFADVNKAKRKAESTEGSSPVNIHKIAEVRSKVRSIGVLSDSDTVVDGAGEMVSCLQEGEGLARAKALTRFLTELPANILTTSVFVDTVSRVVETLNAQYDNKLELQIFGPDQDLSGRTTKSLRMGLLNSVHQGSTMPGPYMIRVKYRGGQADGQSTVSRVVGKTMIFDDGGRANKGKFAGDMKADMGGGATVLGAMAAIAEAGTERDIDFCFAVCANENGDSARRMDDVMLAASGKTVEEGHTDAEGREALADVVHVSHKLIDEDGDKVGSTLTVATLTGAAVNSSGHRIPVVSFNTSAARLLADETAKTGEYTQSLTADHTDTKAMKGATADLNNLGAKPGQRGVTKAYAFIHAAADTPKEEANDTLHLDIASSISKEPGHPTDVAKHQFSAGEGVGAVVTWADKFAS